MRTTKQEAINALTNLGLTLGEAKTYVSLIRIGTSYASDVARFAEDLSTAGRRAGGAGLARADELPGTQDAADRSTQVRTVVCHGLWWARDEHHDNGWGFGSRCHCRW